MPSLKTRMVASLAIIAVVGGIGIEISNDCVVEVFESALLQSLLDAGDHFFSDFGSFESGADGILSVGQDVIGDQRTDGGAAGGVWILIDGYVLSVCTRFFHHVQGLFASSPVLLSA